MTTFTPGPWTLDPAGSSVSFAHKTFWGLATVKGVFAKVRGEGTLAADGSAEGRLVVDAASLDTKHAKRDKHLRSKGFFEVDAHPEIVFTAASVTPAADGTAKVEGELRVRGHSAGLSFPVRYESQGTDAAVLRGSIEVDRAQFGLTWNQVGMLRGLTTVGLELRFVAG